MAIAGHSRMDVILFMTPPGLISTLEIAFHSTANHLRQAGRLRPGEPAAQSFSNQEMSLNPRFQTRKTGRNATAFES